MYIERPKVEVTQRNFVRRSSEPVVTDSQSLEQPVVEKASRNFFAEKIMTLIAGIVGFAVGLIPFGGLLGCKWSADTMISEGFHATARFCLAAVAASGAGAFSLWAGSEALALFFFGLSALLNATGTSAALNQYYAR